MFSPVTDTFDVNENILRFFDDISGLTKNNKEYTHG